MKKKIALLLTIALGTGLLFGCGSTKESSSNSSSEVANASVASQEDNTKETAENQAEAAENKELITIRLATASAQATLTENAKLTQELGYFDEELAKVGYKVEYVGFAGAGPAINEALAAKEVEYAFYAELPIFVANSNGVGITAIATANNAYSYAILATEASGINSGADLAGKKIIAPYGTILFKYLLEVLDAYNLTIDDVEIINSLADSQTLLASGDADALISTYGGTLMYAAYGLGKVVENSSEGAGEGAGLVLAGRSEFVAENPEANKALIRALYRAFQYAQENPEEVYGLLASESSPEAVNRQTYAFDPTFTFFKPIFTEDYLERAASIYEFSVQNQLLGGTDISVDTIFDATYGSEVEKEFQ